MEDGLAGTRGLYWLQSWSLFEKAGAETYSGQIETITKGTIEMWKRFRSRLHRLFRFALYPLDPAVVYILIPAVIVIWLIFRT